MKLTIIIVFAMAFITGCNTAKETGDNRIASGSQSLEPGPVLPVPTNLSPFMLDTPTSTSSGWQESDVVVAAINQNGVGCREIGVSFGTRTFGVDPANLDRAREIAIAVSNREKLTLRLKSNVDSDVWDLYISGEKIKTESYVVDKEAK